MPAPGRALHGRCRRPSCGRSDARARARGRAPRLSLLARRSWWKMSKIASWCSGAMPGPVSLTRIATRPPAARLGLEVGCRRDSVNLLAFASRFWTMTRSFAASAATAGRSSGMSARNSTGLAAHEERERLAELAQEGRQRRRPRAGRSHRARLELATGRGTPRPARAGSAALPSTFPKTRARPRRAGAERRPRAAGRRSRR